MEGAVISCVLFYPGSCPGDVILDGGWGCMFICQELTIHEGMSVRRGKVRHVVDKGELYIFLCLLKSVRRCTLRYGGPVGG